MGKAKKPSMTVDERTLEDPTASASVTVSLLVDDTLKQELTRMRLKALLDEMEARSPISEQGRLQGDLLWEQTVSFWTQARSRRSAKKKRASARRSAVATSRTSTRK
jgi:hypothetical protein